MVGKVIKDGAGEEIIFTVDKNLKVRKLLLALSNLKGFRITDLWLLYKGEMLTPERPFSDYDLVDGNQLDLWIRPAVGN